MTTEEKRNVIVRSALSRERKNKYSQSADKRTRIESGYGDCSGTVWYWYYKLLGMNIGGNTEAQINKGRKVDVAINNGVPDEKNMRKGDLLFFRGQDNSRTDGVGHVEMYIGDGKIFGHGSGVGGTVKVMRDYCKMRQGQKSTEKLKNKGLICVKRYIEDDELTEVNDIVWELAHRGIVSDSDLWVKKLGDDVNAYWLARKTVQFLIEHDV